jgi:hypothetical protein
MMKFRLFFVVLAMFVAGVAGAQSREALEGNYNLQERYEVMKEKAESYSDYKVIKISIMDGVWKIYMDSLALRKQQLAAANQSIKKLQGEITGAADQVKKAEETMAASEYERTHLSAFGIPVAKGFFVSFVSIIIGALVVTLLVALGSVRVLRRANKEKEVTVNAVSSEFEAFRKKALDKEVKISRELQSERNKLQAIMKG